MPLFPDPLHDEFASWALGLAPYGGGDIGEVELLASQTKPGDDGSFFETFAGYARRRIEEGDAAAAGGHRATARDCYLRAASFLGIAYHPLYGTPVDPRLVDAFDLQMETFEKFALLGDAPAERVEVRYEGTKLPAYLFRAHGGGRETRPLILVGGGWDSTLVENYLGIGVAALRRGYHVLLHDGPGQGRLLINEGLPLRHDWEKVVTPVVDAALHLEGIDPRRIVYQPWSLGGYMAPRVAAFEHRLAAVIADPGQIDVGIKVVEGLGRVLGPAAAARLPEIAPDDARKVEAFLAQNRALHWKIVQRGYWTNGAPDLASWLVEMARWKLTPTLVAEIRCPTMVASAESDQASSNARELYEALRCPKAFLSFRDADGAGMHCEFLNRSMANRQILDWLDDTLRAVG